MNLDQGEDKHQVQDLRFRGLNPSTNAGALCVNLQLCIMFKYNSISDCDNNVIILL